MADGQTSNDAVNKGQLDAQNMALKSADTELEKKINTKANLTLDNLDNKVYLKAKDFEKLYTKGDTIKLYELY